MEEHGTRVIRRWIAEPGTDISEQDVELSGTIGDWDQFEANRQFLGDWESTYPEDFYTTPLDKNSELYKARSAKAEKMAREIEEAGKTRVQSQDRKGLSPANEKLFTDSRRFAENEKQKVLETTRKQASKPRAEKLDSLRKFNKHFKLPAQFSSSDASNEQGSTSTRANATPGPVELPNVEGSGGKSPGSSVVPGALGLKVQTDASPTMRPWSNPPSLTDNRFAPLGHLEMAADQEPISPPWTVNFAVAQMQQKQESQTTHQGPTQQLQPARIAKRGGVWNMVRKKNHKRRGATPQ